MPLSIHPWARQAAEAAGCAQLQSNEAFWSLHDLIFRNQATINAGNAKEKLSDLAKASKGLDAAAFQKCMESGMSVGLVLKDMDLATANQISGTPTLFINGHRIQGVDSAAKLRGLIEEAKKEATAATHTSAVLQKPPTGTR
jgi:protein-disulfide isomerase